MEDYYVGNSEIVSLIDEWRNSEEKQSLEKKILDKVSFLIYTKIRIYRKESFYDDLVQEGKLALLAAMNDFDKEKGLNFFTVAAWHLSSHFKKTLKWAKRKSIDSYSIDVNKDPREMFEQKEQLEVVQKAVKELPEMYKKIIVMRYGIFNSETYTLQQIGDMFSVSKQYIDCLEKKAIESLRKNSVVREIHD
jgi:RNA polymerase sigma factor (sigma-70 family)